MTNAKFLKEQTSSRRRRGRNLLNPAYKNMLQMADARTSGTAVTRIFSILEVNGRDETKAFEYMKKKRRSVQLYTKSGGGGHAAGRLGQAGGRHLLHRGRARHQGQGLRRRHQLPRRASAPRRRPSRVKAPRIPSRQEG